MTSCIGKRKRYELPPTAGLPLAWDDYWRKPRQSFAASLAQWPGLPEPLMTCSGTAALVVALKTLHRRYPDKNAVIMPAYNCPLVPLATCLVPGLRAIICDTVAGGIDLDPQQLDKLCDQRTLAVIPTHLGGRVADVEAVKAIAARYGALIIEDAAQALGAFTSVGWSVGLAGDIGFFSLAAGKGLTTYEGGVLVSRDAQLRTELAATAQETLQPDLGWTLRRNLELLGYRLLYTPSGLKLAYGRNLRRKLAAGDEAAAVGDCFTLADIPLHSLDVLRLRVAANGLARLPAYLEQGRKRAAPRYCQLAALPGVSVIGDRQGADGTWPFFMVLMPSKEQRDRALRQLWRSGKGVSKLFVHALQDYGFLAPVLTGHHQPDCPQARDLADRMLTVSNTHWLDDETFVCIATALRKSL
ncbi:MAG: DegT/DnrJ/EryC1/StrS family aminotransferase [Proteobacteria bacterium]|nr:DegT/DnrJ/EryC1/StrS family aminotransferase [Pseudomonadota bacterium]